MILQGKATSGIGIAKMWVSKIENIFKEKTGMSVLHGTLNIKLSFNYKIQPDFHNLAQRIWRYSKCFSKTMQNFWKHGIYSKSGEKPKWYRRLWFTNNRNYFRYKL